MQDQKQLSREYCHALLYEFLLRIRHGGGGKEEDAAIAYALHNLPAILMAPDWTDKIASEAYRDVVGNSHLSGASDWFAEKKREMAERLDGGRDLIDEWRGN